MTRYSGNVRGRTATVSVQFTKQR